MLQMLFNHTSYNVSYLDGSMKYEDRAKAVDEFNSDPNQFVFLISTKAGGVGLNITSANKVVVVDPNWNPAYDLQAQDRAYRIGQVRDVEVFRLVSVGTIEEIVYARQIYKQQQAEIGYTASSERRYFKGVQEKADQKGEIFGMQNLFAYQHDNVVLRDIVNKTNVAESRAGVQVTDFEVKEDDDNVKAEDEAMSQIAAMVRGETDAEASKTEPARSHDPIQAILAGAGVEYTHLRTTQPARRASHQ
jgi:superfamily II DNA/RNA helicase